MQKKNATVPKMYAKLCKNSQTSAKMSKKKTFAAFQRLAFLILVFILAQACTIRPNTFQQRLILNPVTVHSALHWFSGVHASDHPASLCLQRAQPFWDHFGTVLGIILYFGVVLGSSGGRFGHFLEDFGTILESFWDYFGVGMSAFGLFWALLEPILGSFGASLVHFGSFWAHVARPPRPSLLQTARTGTGKERAGDAQPGARSLSAPMQRGEGEVRGSNNSGFIPEK